MAGLDSISSVTTPLIDRARSDPSSDLEHKRESVYDAPKQYRSFDDLLTANDIESSSIRRLSVEVIPVKRAHRRREDNEEVLVPPRDVLVKVPFFTTPLMLEATNNAFYDFRDRLIEMGFEKESEASLVHTQCESVENAITFILNNPDAIYHRFQENHRMSLQIISEIKDTEDMDSDTHRLCRKCQQPLHQHLIDHNGNKISIGLNEDNYNEYLNELVYLDQMALMLEQKNEDNFFQRSIDRSLYHDILDKTEALMPPSPVYNDPKQQCLICFDEKPSNMFMQSECGHDRYCNECLTEHYRVKITNGDVLKVKCIDMKCDREVKESEILNLLTDDALKKKFHKFKRQKLLMLDENARFCVRVDCDGYMIGSRLKPKLVCPECSTTICFNCSKLWHGYFTKCRSQVDELDEQFFQWELNKKDNVKKCPKCKFRIEKNEGCNHMTCVACKYQFCWICKGKYTSNHYKKWNVFGCPGAQFSGSSLWSIQRCPDCCPMWLRRLLCCPFIMIGFILVVPIVLVLGILFALAYACVFCVRCFCECCCDRY